MDLSELFSAHRGIISEKIMERKVRASLSMRYVHEPTKPPIVGFFPIVSCLTESE